MDNFNPYQISVNPLAPIPPSKPKFGSKKMLAGLFGFLVLAGSLTAGTYLVQKQQIFGEKAAAPSTTAEKIADIAKSIGQTSTPTNNISYTSTSLGYQINFDNNYWAAANSTDLTKQDLTNIDLSLNDATGKAQINFKTYGQDDLNQKIATAGRPAASGIDNLDLLAKSLTNTLKPTSQKRITMDGRDFYVFTYETTFLNQKSEYYDYITINGNNYYVINVKYSTLGSGAELSQLLLNSLQFPPLTPTVKGASTDSSSTTTLDESKIVELTKPSVVQIAHVYCNDINIPDLSGTKFLKPSYTFCGGATGSGFIINKDGFIGTNGHVVKNYPEEAFMGDVVAASPGIAPFAIDLIREVVSAQTHQEISSDQAQATLNQVEKDPTSFNSFMTLIYDLMNKNIILLKENQNKYFVKLANDPFVITPAKSETDILNVITPSATIKEAQFINSNYPNIFSLDAVVNGKKPTGSDVAIIKITDPGSLTFPSINLGDSAGLKEGSDVIVIGYPGAANNSSLVDAKSSAQPTVTRGIISAIKNDQGGLKLIQVDASINHGNSGGPAFNSQGQVIGIATYGSTSTSGNYNFLRDINDLKKLASDNSIDVAPSQTYNEWSQGLNYFWVEHYLQAEVPFTQVAKSYPIHPSVASYIADSSTAVQKGQDKSGLIFLLTNDRATQIKFGGGVLGLIVIIAGIVFFVMKKKGNTNPPTTQYTPPTPVQTYQPVPAPMPVQPVQQVPPSVISPQNWS